MKIFLDTANLREIREANALGLLDGVTTNPSLMAKEGIFDYDEHYRRICEEVDGDVSAEVIATDYEGMVREARHLASLHKNIVVKIPFTKDGVKAIQRLREEGIRVNCTLIFSPMQALLAAKAGAAYVSPFIGRLDDISHEGTDLVLTIRQIFDNYGFETEILAASIRHPHHVLKVALIGADVVTLPYSVFSQLFHHPLTDIGLEKFLQDHQRAREKQQHQ